MTTLLRQHGYSKNNVPILLLQWVICLIRIKTGKNKTGSEWCASREKPRQGGPSSPWNPLTPTFCCATFWNFSQPRPPKIGASWDGAHLITWAPCYISLCHDAFHSVKMLPFRGPVEQWAATGTGADRGSISEAGFRDPGSQIWQTLRRPAWPVGATKCSTEVDSGKEKGAEAGACHLGATVRIL